MNSIKILQDEINALRKEIYTESYSMSIGELSNLYKEDELDIHPEFQRLYRWNPSQKTRLIESVMLDIPMPSIFVSQNDVTGIWDVIDGVQRLSTFFEFMGILKDDSQCEVPPFILEKTKYLPSFNGVTWKKTNKDGTYFTKEMQMDFKRYRIDIKIVKKESDKNKKYELFQRLNTGGTRLEPQEVRNCLMIMTNPKIYEVFKKMSENDSFIKCTPISDLQEDKQYRTELLTRYIVAKKFNSLTFDNDYTELSDLLDNEIINICNDDSFNIEQEKELFERIFVILEKCLGESSFKSYKNDKFSGALLSSAFVAITVGIGKNIDTLTEEFITDKVKNMYSNEGFTKYTANGVKPIKRLIELSRFGSEYFENK